MVDTFVAMYLIAIDRLASLQQYTQTLVRRRLEAYVCGLAGKCADWSGASLGFCISSRPQMILNFRTCTFTFGGENAAEKLRSSLAHWRYSSVRTVFRACVVFV
jgi:hypothetical protein